ncbi:mitochondrial carrier [Fomitopsis serialis]|uniref:mitochondrial carrier n=1 Tax=Fomitopsis serialis TaxID=139415 RepID=UPI002008B873|nr:mitochondrial carrier [Neoantrodia serialis]KAH9915696.1 mitochondrial carrier [Neoantrodia serialis]
MSTNGENSQYVLKFAGAAISNMAASAATNPLDIVKVRQQLRTQTPGARTNAFWTVGVEMARTEGVLSLMKGFSASMLRELVYSGMRLGSYEYFKDVLYERSRGSLSREGIGLKVAAATIASALGSAIANPTDLVKVRMQAYYPSGSPYRNMRHAFAMIWKEGVAPAASTGLGSVSDGLRALYRGSTPTTVRGIVLSVSQICSYDQAKQVLKRRELMQEGVGLHFVASMFAGLVCSITSNPVDVVKVRLMNDSGREYQGVSDCVRNIMAKEGPLAFYKGFGMCWARLGLHTVLTFVVFERLRLLFGVGAL